MNQNTRKREASKEPILSKDNKFFKLILSIKSSRTNADSYFVVEGQKFIDSMLTSGKPEAIFCQEGNSVLLEKYLNLYQEIQLSCFSKTLWQQVSALENPADLLAIFQKPKLSLDDLNTNSILILDEIQDPGNLGTLIRTALAAGWSEIICLQKTADPYSHKVVRASAGAIAGAKIFTNVLVEELVDKLSKFNPTIYTTALDAENFVDWQDLDTKKISGAKAVVLGNEGHGISASLQKSLKSKFKVIEVKIPMKNSGFVESLNVSVAGALMLYKLA
jgi:RNA methyltransferase, TrmH family